MGPRTSKAAHNTNGPSRIHPCQDDMFDVTSPGAQHAIHSISNWLSGLPDSQAPMPSPNVASKIPAKKTPEKKGADLGQKLARRKSQDLKSKIVDWNERAAGIAQGQDEVVVVEEKDYDDQEPSAEVVAEVETNEENGEAENVKDDTAPTSPKTPVSGVKAAAKQKDQRKTSREIDIDKKAWVRRRSKPQVEAAKDTKEVATPKKRVVSDAAWRRDRQQKKDISTPEKKEEKKKDTTPKPVTVRRSVVSVGLKVPPSVHDFEEIEQEPIRRRPLTRHSRSRSRSRDRDDGRAETPDYDSSGLKVYIKRRRKTETKEHKGFSTSESSFTANSSLDRPSTATEITIPDVSPTKDHPPRPSTAPKDGPSRRFVDDEYLRKTSRQSLEAEDAPRRVSRKKLEKTAPDDENDVFKIPKVEKGHQSARKLSKEPEKEKEPPRPVPKVFGNRIEGWLAEMPEDRFSEDLESSLAPEPLNLSRKKQQRPAEDSEDDYGARRSRVGSQNRRSQPNLEPIDTNARSRPPSGARMSADDWSDNSPAESPTLKRSGARRNTHSPVKDRAMRGASAHVDDSMNPSTEPGHDSRRHRAAGMYEQRLPSDGHRLPTIASARTFQSPTLHQRPREHSNDSGHATIIPDGSALSRASDGDDTKAKGSALKRRLTKHSDLISVLSLPREDDHNIVSARSIRTRRPRHDTATVGDLMNEVTTDELKYQRELRTMVEGVIPVLLTYVLAKNDSRRVSGSRISSVRDTTALTQPIVEMGVALERLKAAHKRIPMHDPDELLRWADGATQVYSEYLRVWRLDFKDVVVNLAPAEETGKRNGSAKWDDGLPRDEHGDLLDGDGERVDVAYLLKRPLVRLRYLEKTLKGINQIRPSKTAEDMTLAYHELVLEARRRANDERARLEDEVAAAIDATRSRDPRSLAPLTGVEVDRTRIVRARDYFDMQMYHSSGQQLDCKIEIIMRDDAPGRGKSGDLLFCEISTTGRWLLFPPVSASLVSSRRGDKEGETIVMVRGMLASGSEWREAMSLQSNEEQVAEWIQMLGSDPMPPRLTRQSSFNTLRGPSVSRNAPPSPTESELPIGERARPTAPRWDGSEVNSVFNDASPSNTRRAEATRYRSSPSSSLAKGGSSQTYDRYDSDPGLYDDKLAAGRTRAKAEWTSDGGGTRTKKDYNVWIPSSDHGPDESDVDEGDRVRPQARPGMHRRTSSVPSLEMPTINKLRKSSQPKTPRKYSSDRRAESSPTAGPNEPASAPAKLQKRRPTPSKVEANDESTKGPPPPNHARPTSLGLRSSVLPSFTPAFMKKHRRSSSPLKHEYEPSTATESSSESGLSDIDDEESVTSDSTADEGVSTLGELKDFSKFGHARPFSQPPPAKTSYSVKSDTLGPSESASQAPYRTVPPNDAGSAKSVACIFSWSERGAWDGLHPEECEIVVTPGMIEAFDLAQAHAVAPNSGSSDEPSPSARGVKPLVALELTPLVPLRRGTALDISIRSPATANSVLRRGNNFMFRSRSPEECEKLYNLINRARIDNPTWIALQNARGPVPTSNWAEVMDRRNAQRSNSGSWIKSLSRKSTTYRSKGTRSDSVAASQSSVASMSSAFSALRRFSGGSSRIFNIAKSTITSRDGTRSTYSDSLSSGAVTPVPVDPRMGTPLGITNAKIRLYFRETPSKWRDMGSARLTILLPPRSDPAIPADPKLNCTEKHLLICGKAKGETLLDRTLGESSFERVARTGIAVNVYEESAYAGPTGGVMSSSNKVYMMQMRSVCNNSSLKLTRVIFTDFVLGTRRGVYF